MSSLARGIVVGGPYRTARLAIIATVIGIFAAAPVSAFDTPSDKNITGGVTTNSDDWTKELEVDLAPLALNMWGAQKTAQ